MIGLHEQPSPESSHFPAVTALGCGFVLLLFRVRSCRVLQDGSWEFSDLEYGLHPVRLYRLTVP